MMRIQKYGNNAFVLIFLLSTSYNRKIVKRLNFINFHFLKKNTYCFNKNILLYLSGSLQLLCVELHEVGAMIPLNLPCLFCLLNGYIYTTFEFSKISSFICFLDLLHISFLMILSLSVS